MDRSRRGNDHEAVQQAWADLLRPVRWTYFITLEGHRVPVSIPGELRSPNIHEDAQPWLDVIVALSVNLPNLWG